MCMYYINKTLQIYLLHFLILRRYIFTHFFIIEILYTINSKICVPIVNLKQNIYNEHRGCQAGRMIEYELKLNR